MLRALRATPPPPALRAPGPPAPGPSDATTPPLPRRVAPEERPVAGRRLDLLGLAGLPRAVGAALLGVSFAGAVGCGAALPPEPARVAAPRVERLAPDPERFRAALVEVATEESARPPERRVGLAGSAGAAAASNPAFFDERRRLRDGLRPSAAIDDILFGDGSRTALSAEEMTRMVSLGATQRYYQKLFGADAGALRFDLDFADDGGWGVEQFHRARALGELPRGEAGLAVLGVPPHLVRFDFHRPLWPRVELDDRLVTDRGTPESRRLGLDRLPVIDLGVVEGVRTVWSHPRGVEPLAELARAVSAPELRIDHPGELRDRLGGGVLAFAFEHDRGLAAALDRPVAGSAEARHAAERKRADLALSHAVLARLLDAVEPARLELAIAFFRTGARVTTPADADLLLSACGPAGVFSLAQAFDETLPETRRDELLAELPNPSLADKARLALYVTLVGDRHGPVLRLALEQRRELDVVDELKPGGGLSGPEGFARFLGSPELDTVWRARTGRGYAGPTDASRLSVAEIRAIVEVLLPSTARLDRRGGGVLPPEVGGDPLSGLLAELLAGTPVEPRLEPRASRAIPHG